MLDTFISLAATAGEIGTVTAASLYPSGFISIDVEQDGKTYALTYCAVTQVEEQENADS